MQSCENFVKEFSLWIEYLYSWGCVEANIKNENGDNGNDNNGVDNNGNGIYLNKIIFFILFLYID